MDYLIGVIIVLATVVGLLYYQLKFAKQSYRNAAIVAFSYSHTSMLDALVNSNNIQKWCLTSTFGWCIQKRCATLVYYEWSAELDDFEKSCKAAGLSIKKYFVLTPFCTMRGQLLGWHLLAHVSEVHEEAARMVIDDLAEAAVMLNN